MAGDGSQAGWTSAILWPSTTTPSSTRLVVGYRLVRQLQDSSDASELVTRVGGADELRELGVEKRHGCGKRQVGAPALTSEPFAEPARRSVSRLFGAGAPQIAE